MSAKVLAIIVSTAVSLYFWGMVIYGVLSRRIRMYEWYDRSQSPSDYWLAMFLHVGVALFAMILAIYCVFDIGPAKP